MCDAPSYPYRIPEWPARVKRIAAILTKRVPESPILLEVADALDMLRIGQILRRVLIGGQGCPHPINRPEWSGPGLTIEQAKEYRIVRVRPVASADGGEELRNRLRISVELSGAVLPGQKGAGPVLPVGESW